MKRDAHAETLRDAPGALHEMRGAGGGADLVRGLFENSQPAREMGPVHGERQVSLHRLAAVAAAHQGDRRPEGAHLLQVRVPVLHAGGEDRAQERVVADAGVEGPDQPLDLRFGDAGPGDDLLDDLVAAGAGLDRKSVV